jgi:hypothetical protein
MHRFGLVAHHYLAHNRMIAAGIGMKRLGRNRIDDLVRHGTHALSQQMAACLSSWVLRPPPTSL